MGREERNCYLNAEIAPVDVVAEEEVARVGGRPPHLEQLHQVVELAVHVAAHRDRRLHLDHRPLLPQQRAALADDAQRHRLLHAPLQHEVPLEHVDARLALAVEHLRARQQVRRRQWHVCKREQVGLEKCFWFCAGGRKYEKLEN